MKSFSNLAGFIEALKVGSTIKIVEHKIIPESDGIRRQKTNDTVMTGVICDIKADSFGVAIDGTEHWFTLDAEQEPFKGSHPFYNAKYSTNKFYIYEHTITFKTVATPLVSHSFVLISDEKSHCPVCKGSGVQAITCETFGFPEKSISLHTCYHCHGEIVNAAVGAEIQADVDYEKSLWCKCRRRHDVYFMADGVDKEIKKHHYRCCKCNKVRQIG
jgi:hypothetical protein